MPEGLTPDALSSAPTPRLESAALRAAGFSHAFFTRAGGVSLPPWASLNFAANTGDSPVSIDENLARAAIVLSADPARIYYASQVHGVDVLTLDGTEDRREVVRREADAVLSRTSGVVCAVRSADCGTVLVGDRRTRSVVAIHAGWRGAVAGVVERGVEALLGVGAMAGDLVAAIGPHIGPCCFEVGSEVALELAAASSLGEGAVVRREGAKAFVDLRGILARKLEVLGVGTVDHVPGCTVCDAETFFSYRREGRVSGRLLSAISAG